MGDTAKQSPWFFLSILVALLNLHSCTDAIDGNPTWREKHSHSSVLS